MGARHCSTCFESDYSIRAGNIRAISRLISCAFALTVSAQANRHSKLAAVQRAIEKQQQPASARISHRSQKFRKPGIALKRPQSFDRGLPMLNFQVAPHLSSGPACSQDIEYLGIQQFWTTADLSLKRLCGQGSRHTKKNRHSA